MHIFHGDNITSAICVIIHTSGLEVGFTKTDVRTQYLRVGGEMVILLVRVDMDTIFMLGRWQSNIILS